MTDPSKLQLHRKNLARLRYWAKTYRRRLMWRLKGGGTP